MVIRGGVCLLMLSVFLAGCSGEEPPSALPPLPSAIASQEAPEPARPSLPPAAESESPAGASAFARFYLSLMNDAFRTGEGASVRALTDEGCGGCRNLLASVGPAEDGSMVVGGDYEVLTTATAPFTDGDALVDLSYARTGAKVLAQNGEVLEMLPPVGRQLAQMRVQRVGTTWRVLGFRLVTE